MEFLIISPFLLFKGKNQLSKMMQTISKKAGLSTVYTSHCVRASMITVLFQAGVQPKEICAITKHRRETSLDPYIRGTSSEQKKRCSNVLSTALGLEVLLLFLKRSIFKEKLPLLICESSDINRIKK